MAQGSISKTMGAVFVALVISKATTTVSAQDVGLAPAPAPSMDTGTAFSLPIRGVFVAFSLIISLFAFLIKH
ncbi:hypothetical protein COLO4_17021 [Corchorus olitorius]|uniref:Transmembrane protein n=1 Tax=Corchorus olitorius TaxID=93759 RepID=A0A1R3JEM7_9ROSI|nr:hypothetical protein COLO4_17021 [Corchorus olitorius]